MNIVKLRDDVRGFAWYAFSFIWDLGCRHVGVMAQELAKAMPEAVRVGDDGWWRVNYGAL